MQGKEENKVRKFLRSTVGILAVFIMAVLFLATYALWLTGTMVGSLWLLITYMQNQPDELMSGVAVAAWIGVCWGAWQVKERWLDDLLGNAITYGCGWAIEFTEG